MARRCAPAIHPNTLKAVVTTESSHNPFAIGVVGGALSRQPRNLNEALEVVQLLEKGGFNYSLGISQVNKKNLSRVGLDVKSAFDPCQNLKGGGQILQECYVSAKQKGMDDQAAMKAALSCYYSGNFTTGIQLGYVDTVIAAANGKKPQAKIKVIKGPLKEAKNEVWKERKPSDASLVF